MKSVRGKCDSCALDDVEIKPYRVKNDERRNLCNQCRPADGAYAY